MQVSAPSTSSSGGDQLVSLGDFCLLTAEALRRQGGSAAQVALLEALAVGV